MNQNETNLERKHPAAEAAGLLYVIAALTQSRRV